MPLDNGDIALKSSFTTYHPSQQNDKNRQMGNIGPKTCPRLFLSEQPNGTFFGVASHMRKTTPQRFRQSMLHRLERLSNPPFAKLGTILQPPVRGRQIRASDLPPDAGQTVYRASGEIEGKQPQQADKPPRMVHVIKLQEANQMGRDRPQTLMIFSDGEFLRQDGPENGTSGQKEQSKKGELQGTQAAPQVCE